MADAAVTYDLSASAVCCERQWETRDCLTVVSSWMVWISYLDMTSTPVLCFQAPAMVVAVRMT